MLCLYIQKSQRTVMWPHNVWAPAWCGRRLCLGEEKWLLLWWTGGRDRHKDTARRALHGPATSWPFSNRALLPNGPWSSELIRGLAHSRACTIFHWGPNFKHMSFWGILQIQAITVVSILLSFSYLCFLSKLQCQYCCWQLKAFWCFLFCSFFETFYSVRWKDYWKLSCYIFLLSLFFYTSLRYIIDKMLRIRII